MRQPGEIDLAREKKCPRCAEVVKADALVCRYCGHEFSVAEVRRSREPMGCLKLSGIGIAVLIGLVVFTGVVTDSQSPVDNVTAVNHTATENPADLKQKSDETSRGELAFAAGKAIKQSVRNPDSLVIEQASSNNDGSLLCVEYRAQNGFGGMNREFVAFQNGKTHQSSSFWNKHCRKGLHDQTYNVKTGASLL